ncbi:hypothetical protein CYMTET_24952 [Cymbomonas tetramitiformis]|uniref:Protein ENHANCED DISEASE RESISTANCE 2 C-terminal domain-containing protein n=1 Tax=Cymbomonas tetramitiformis TaxID=36881 RepID=A0AAE0FUT7_9CHLO|nr:hypothetical protein CYMTET_24952 [Cymbomonas tetramitiformis]
MEVVLVAGSIGGVACFIALLIRFLLRVPHGAKRVGQSFGKIEVADDPAQVDEASSVPTGGIEANRDVVTATVTSGDTLNPQVDSAEEGSQVAGSAQSHLSVQHSEGVLTVFLPPKEGKQELAATKTAAVSDVSAAPEPSSPSPGATFNGGGSRDTGAQEFLDCTPPPEAATSPQKTGGEDVFSLRETELTPMKVSATGETGIKQTTLDTDTIDMEAGDRRTCAPGCSPFSWRRKSRKKTRPPTTLQNGLSPRFSGADPMLSLHSSSGSSLSSSVTSPSQADRKSPASAASPKTLFTAESNGLASTAASTTVIHPVQPLVGNGSAEKKANEQRYSPVPASGKEAAKQARRLSENETFLDALAEHPEPGEAGHEIDRAKSAGEVLSPAAEMEYEKRPSRTPSAPSPEMRRTPSGNLRNTRAASESERPRVGSLDKKPSFSDRVSQFFSRKSMFINGDSPADTASAPPLGSAENSRLRRVSTMLEHPNGIVDRIERPEGTAVERLDIPYEAQSTPVPHSWSTQVPGKSFQVRGRSYLIDKKKVASEECLYYSYSVEAYRTEEKTFDIAGRLKIQADTVAGLPTLLVLNMMVPDYTPSFGFKAKAQDGPGISIIVYAAMTKQTRAALEALQRGEEVAPVYTLLRNFLKGDGPGTDSPNLESAPAHKNEYRTRVKVMAKVAGGQDSLPWAVKMALNQGNGKPFIVSKCGTFIDHERGVFEIDSDVHNFIPMALKGLNNCKSYFTQLLMDIGLVIEARNSQELPEQMLLTYRFCNPDLKQVVQNIKSLNT